jgi:hypothetical protein
MIGYLHDHVGSVFLWSTNPPYVSSWVKILEDRFDGLFPLRCLKPCIQLRFKSLSKRIGCMSQGRRLPATITPRRSAQTIWISRIILNDFRLNHPEERCGDDALEGRQEAAAAPLP